MFFKSLSIREKILLLPVLTLILFFILITVDRTLKARFDIILQESETCHQITFLLAELVNKEVEYVETENKSLLPEIENKKQKILELLKTSSIIIPGYRDPTTNNTIENIIYLQTTDFLEIINLQNVIDETRESLAEFYEIRNGVIQQRLDEIYQLTIPMLMEGKDIHGAKKEFVLALNDFTQFDSQATLNTTELFHFNDESKYLQKEIDLQDKIDLLARTCDTLSSVTGDIYDRDTWVEVEGYQYEINKFRYDLYTLWKDRQELIGNRPVTDEAIAHFTSYITQRAGDEIETIDDLNNELLIATMTIIVLILAASSYAIARNIISPITTITTGTKKIEEGDFDVHISIPNKDELGTLANVFNDMVTRQKEMITILAENEKKYRQVLEATNTIPRELDLSNMKFTYFGKQAERILGYPVESWVDFATCASRMHPDDRDQTISQCMEATERLENHDSIYRMFHQDGSIRWIHDVVSVVPKKGKPDRIIGFMHDITDKKLAEEERVYLEEKLQQSQKMEAIGTLAGGIAHDFNNLLGIIIGYIGMAKDDAPRDSSISSDLSKALQASKRAKDMVKQILAFSRQSGAEKKPFQPATIVKEAIKMLRSSIPSTINIHDQINPNSKTILADPTQVHQVLMNICTNAYQSMEETGGTITISLDNVFLASKDQPLSTNLSMEDEFVMLTVSDTGPGLDPTIKDKIFDPYFTTKDTGKGTGIGLAIVHGIVTDHGGMIDVESKPGNGTTFRVYFPVTDQLLSDTEDDKTPVPRGTERILFVDDEKLLNEMAEEMLTRLGYKVTATSDSLEALEMFKNQPDQFDMVITDQTMPKLTGMDLSRQILQIRPDIPIILATGFSETTSEEEVKSSGIKELIFKPFLKPDMARIIRKVLDG